MEKTTGESGLLYMRDDRPGFGRKRSGKGFVYLNPKGPTMTRGNTGKWNLQT